jgi:hypothetical protein
MARNVQFFSAGIEAFRSSIPNHLFSLEGGVFDLIRACGRLAPDPHSHGRTHLPDRRPRLSTSSPPARPFIGPSSEFRRSRPPAFRQPTPPLAAAPGKPAVKPAKTGPRLDAPPASALVLQAGSDASGLCERTAAGFQRVCRQRSFNWQSTAFVMRGLWVRFPPLALQSLVV